MKCQLSTFFCLLTARLRPTNRFGVFYLAIPVGGALGFGVGALVGSATSWRLAFLACGLPGLAAAWSCAGLHDPPRGGLDPPGPNDTCHRARRATDPDTPATATAAVAARGGNDKCREAAGGDAGGRRDCTRLPSAEPGAEICSPTPPGSPPPFSDAAASASSSFSFSSSSSSSSSFSEADARVDAWTHDAWLIVRNPYYVCTTLGLAANNFALGGLADFYASFASRCLGASVS